MLRMLIQRMITYPFLTPVIFGHKIKRDRMFLDCFYSIRSMFHGISMRNGLRVAKYGGMSIVFPSREDPFFDDVWLRNVYYPYTPKREDVVFDIGAHMGFFTLKMAKKVKWVIACEPDPQNFMFLMYNIKYNNLSNVKAFNCALGERDCDCVFLDREYGGGRTKVTWSITRMRTKMRTLDTLVKYLGLDPDFIKIDVEGYELQVLEGAKNVLARFKPSLIIAAYHYPTEVEEIANYLAELGFRCFYYRVPLVLQKTKEVYVFVDRGKAF